MARAALDLTGQRFGRLVAERYAGYSRHGHRIWVCHCDCGATCEVAASDLARGFTRSCGCLLAEMTGERNRASASDRVKHGACGTPLYGVWLSLKNRCLCPTNPRFQQYGGRGITVCAEWRDSFEAFRDWAVSSGYKPGLSIDRLDNDGGYCPENCRWATRSQQQNNRRVTVMLDFKGRRVPLADLAAERGMSQGKLRWRIKGAGMSADGAVFAPESLRGVPNRLVGVWNAVLPRLFSAE